MIELIKVVIVEDESLVRQGLVFTTPWNDFGCEVVGTAANGLEGLELVAKLEPEIVFTDIRMPGMTGLEMISRLKERVDAEYIIITGYSEFEYAKKAVKLGVKDYLLKPIDDGELYEIIRNVATLVRQKIKIQKLQAIEELQASNIMNFKDYVLNKENTNKENYISDAIDYLKANYQRDINIKEAAEILHLSESYLSRLFKRETGYTFIEYLTNYRIKKAIDFLKDKNVKIYEISSLVGYGDSRYFSALFRKYVGVTPSEFRDGLNRSVTGEKYK